MGDPQAPEERMVTTEASRPDEVPGPEEVAAPPSDAFPAPPRGSRSLLALAGVFLISLLGALALFSQPVLYDTDSTYHLAIARLIGEVGVPEEIEALRRSLLSPGFGDKELLFHLFLVPFTWVADASPDGGAFAGRLALAVLNALLMTVLAAFGLRAARGWKAPWWGLAVPFVLVLTCPELGWRLIRLRPELLSLPLLLVGLALVAGRRWRWLGLLCFAYTLAYTGFHAFLGLCGLLFLFQGWFRRRWELGLVLYPILGSGLALVAHPGFPANLRIWAVQNVRFFLDKGTLDVGTEILPNTTAVALLLNVGWLAALVCLVVARKPMGLEARREVGDFDHRLADALGLATVLFAGAYVLMSRFSLYVFPLASLWLLFELRRRHLAPGRRIAVGRGLGLPLALGLVVAVGLAAPSLARQLELFRERTSPGPDAIRLTDRRAFSEALPVNAPVAATWRSTGLYLFIAPQGRYLNALDPVFFAAVDPGGKAVETAIFDGREVDVPTALQAALGSQFLAVATPTASPRLLARLDGDPRLEALHRGIHALFQIQTSESRRFIRGWMLAPDGIDGPVAADTDLRSWAPAGGPIEPQAAAVHAFVSPERRYRFGPFEPAGKVPEADRRTDCAVLARPLEAPQGAEVDWELAASGPTTLWLDGEPLVTVRDAPGAVLGQGVLIRRRLEAGAHLLSARTCPPSAAGGATGFYLLQRGARAIQPPDAARPETENPRR